MNFKKYVKLSKYYSEDNTYIYFWVKKADRTNFKRFREIKWFVYFH